MDAAPSRALLLAVLVMACCCCATCDVPGREGDWVTGTATFYDASPEFKSRIDHNFGTLYTGACGFTNQPLNAYQSDDSLVFPREQNAAIGGANADYVGGVCGRCYEVRCRTGLIKKDYNASDSYVPIGGVPFYVTAPDVKDVHGRSFPGALSDRYIGAKCWNDTGSVVVHISDTCPCHRPEAQGGYNPPCCGPGPHFDLSYWAWSHLAHPLYGNMAIQFRPVNCSTHAPLSAGHSNSPTGIPGGATSVVFDSGIQYGWGLTLSNATWANWTLPVGGGGIAACATLQPQGVLGWQCFPGCHDLFTGGPVRLTVREAQSVTGYPAGGSNGGLNDLPVKLLISRAFFNETNAVGEAICQGTPMLNGNTTSGPPGAERVQGASGGFVTIQFPFDDFQCGARNVTKATANRIELQNAGRKDVSLCVQSLTI